MPDRDFGFLRTADGREVFFHRHAVRHHTFDDLEVGTAVEFAEEAGEHGPQAAWVRPQRPSPR